MKGMMLVLLMGGLIVGFLYITKDSDKKDSKSYLKRTVDSYGKAKKQLNAIDLIQIKRALTTYQAEKGSYPSQLSQLVPNYLRTSYQLKDTWGTNFKLTQSNGSLYLISAGQDKSFNTADDLKTQL